MEASPLTQQARPTSFQPKIDSLYDDIFKVTFMWKSKRKMKCMLIGIGCRQDDVGTTLLEGFWLEFFLLRPDKISLQHRFEKLSSDDLLHFQVFEPERYDEQSVKISAV